MWDYKEKQMEASKIIREIQMETLKNMPLWMRMNWFTAQMSKALDDKHQENEFNWDLINEVCSKNSDPFDYNMYKPVNTVEEFVMQKGDIVFASEGVGIWHKHKCKDCDKEFYMTYREVHFYKDKGLNLPKRCKVCRDKRKTQQND